MTHGCTDCGYDYMGKCEVYEDGTCKRDRAEAYTEVEASTGGNRMTELKSCPFCGGEARINDMGNCWMISRAYRSSCVCRIFMESEQFSDADSRKTTKDNLIKRWNNRLNEAQEEKQ